MLIAESAYVGPVRVLPSGIRACTHLARVNLPGLQVAVVKAFPDTAGRCFFNEVAGSVLAHHSQIGSPPLGLIWIDAGLLQGMFPHASFSISAGKVLCVCIAPVVGDYGLIAIGAGDTYGDSPVLREHLQNWGGLPVCTAFDQWVGNIDRHPNNILVGSGNRLIPIDHSDCFLGPTWEPEDLARPDLWAKCRFDEIIPLHAWTLPTRVATVQQATRWANIYDAAQQDLEQLRAWLPEDDGINWLEWVRARAHLTEDLLKQRFWML